ncbi:MAG: extracellular solute-binding protein [Clostridiales bacterium]|nr:extracellular solute-binding protein [Clostridiales bacterium]
MKRVLFSSIIMIFILFLFNTDCKAIDTAKSADKQVYYDESYIKYLDSQNYSGKTASDEIKVDISSYKTTDGMKASTGNDGVFTDDNGKIEWSFQVKEDGFYNIVVAYIPVKGTNSQIERKMYIDDKIFFDGMNQIIFNRVWDNSDGKQIAKKNGNEILPVAIEKPELTTIYINDSQRRDFEPYKFYFSKGLHTLTFESVKEPLKIADITLKTAPEIKPYVDVLKEWKQKYNVYNGTNILYQAERIDKNTLDIKKSSPDIILSTDYSSSNTVPYSPYKIRLNTIGGTSWSMPGDTIEWEINVPEEGLYRISFRGKQNINRGVTSYRRLRINGEVPFSEALAIGFDFNTGFANYIMGKGQEDFLFHFKKGKNTISLEVVLGDLALPLSQVEKSVSILNDIYRKTTQITGVVPDKNIDYEITKKIPGFAETFKTESTRLKNVVDELIRITGDKGENTAIIEKMQLQAEELSSKPENVVNEINTFESNIAGLGTWITSISKMPLELDSFTLSAPNAKLVRAEPNIFVRFYYNTIRFLSTFFIDETKISDISTKNAVKVWTSAGRDQAQIIKNLIDQDFTPKTGIAVNLQLIPADVILPATLAGNGPDVALNIPQATVINFAMRNALIDLSKLDGFDDIRRMFFDSAIRTVTFKNGIYGLPEQQTFMMMFYREDIMNQLGLKPPKTWDEVKYDISVLHTNNYDFYLPGVEFYSSLIYQYGGDLYKGTGGDYGIESGLTDDNAMVAFNELTKFYTSYKLPVSADFSNRFRTGEIPIGIAPYTTYNQLEVFAPEIKGMWSMVTLPGLNKADGTINNTAVSQTVDCILLKSAKDKDKSWKFMNWWIDTNTQTRYANSLESVMGAAARYPTANIDVMKQLPWPLKYSKQLEEQFKNTVGMPEVPGGYMTMRAADYAFRSVATTNGGASENPREALYLNTKQVNKELTRMRKEFHLSYKDEN